MLDLTGVPIIDNHSHPIDPGRAELPPDRLAREFYHGLGDMPEAGVAARRWGATPELQFHQRHMGVVQTMVARLSALLDCEADLEAVAEARNRRTQQSFAAYIQMLYEDAGIEATVVDSGLPPTDPGLQMIPGQVLRLFQMGPALQESITEAGSWKEALQEYQEGLEHGVKAEGYAGVKTHLAEEVGFSAELPGEAAVEKAFAALRGGDAASYKTLYVAAFAATLLQGRELGIPVHVHSGITGGLWNGAVGNADPFLLAPLLRRPEFIQTKVVLLHGAYPWVQNAAMMAHSLPHVWVDLSWTSPWISLRIVECFRELIGVAPLSKLMVGSGSHNTPEIAWLAAWMDRLGLGVALGEAIDMGLLTRNQAETAGQMVLHDNAGRLYGLRSLAES